MSLQTIQNWLVDYEPFVNPLRRVTKSLIASELKTLKAASLDPPSTDDWDYLLTCASVLASSRIDREQNAALRVATAVLTQANLRDDQRDAAAFLPVNP